MAVVPATDLATMRRRLQDALEGVQNGMTLTDDAALEVVQYVLTGDPKVFSDYEEETLIESISEISLYTERAEMNFMDTTAYYLGNEAFKNGMNYDDNPYHPGTQESDSWLAGFDEAEDLLCSGANIG